MKYRELTLVHNLNNIEMVEIVGGVGKPICDMGPVQLESDPNPEALVLPGPGWRPGDNCVIVDLPTP